MNIGGANRTLGRSKELLGQAQGLIGSQGLVSRAGLIKDSLRKNDFSEACCHGPTEFSLKLLWSDCKAVEKAWGFLLNLLRKTISLLFVTFCFKVLSLFYRCWWILCLF